MEALLTEIGHRRAAVREAERLFGPELAPDFDPVGFFADRELGLSRLLGWMLDPRGSHAQGALFLREFLRLAFDDAAATMRCAEFRVELERTLGEDRGRIDIAVRGPGVLVLIENKPSAKFGVDQLDRYRQEVAASRCERKRLVVLRGWGEADDKVSDTEHHVGLGTRVAEWVDRCARDTRSPDVRSFLGRFARHLRSRFAGITGGRTLDTIADALGKPGMLEQAIAVEIALAKYKPKLLERFREDAAARARVAGLAIVNRGGKPFGDRRWGDLRIDIGHPAFDIVLQNEGPPLDTLWLGLALRQESAREAKRQQSVIRPVIERWGEGVGGEGTDEWLWWDHVESVCGLDASGDVVPRRWAALADGTLADRVVATAAEMKALLVPAQASTTG